MSLLDACISCQGLLGRDISIRLGSGLVRVTMAAIDLPLTSILHFFDMFLECSSFSSDIILRYSPSSMDKPSALNRSIVNRYCVEDRTFLQVRRDVAMATDMSALITRDFETYLVRD